MPLVTGTVVGYSPPLMWGNDDDVVVSNEVEDAEFPTERQKEDEPLFLIFCVMATPTMTLPKLDTRKSESIIGYTEDPLRFPPLRPLSQQQIALSIHKHVHATTSRKQLSLEWKIEYELHPSFKSSFTPATQNTAVLCSKRNQPMRN